MTPHLARFAAGLLAVALLGNLAHAGEPAAAARPGLPPEEFGHALIPDLLADPSIVEFDGVFYCYATTDGEGKDLSISGLPSSGNSRCIEKTTIRLRRGSR